MDTDASDDVAQDEAVLARLDRIVALGRRRAAPGELLDELRGLLSQVELGAASTGSGEEVVERLGTAPHGT